MAITGVSEFTFGFAFLYEQTRTNWGGLTAAPILPSLQEEASAGWDARLPLRGTDYYYQFKLTDYLQNWNAKFIYDGTYQSAYYRINLHPRNRYLQHRRLRTLCATQRRTYYAAPEINDFEEFNRRFLQRQVTSRTRLLPLTECRDIFDDEPHCITFQRGRRGFTQHSEPKHSEETYTGEELTKLYRQSEPEWHVVNLRFAADLVEKSQDIVRRAIADEIGLAESAISPTELNSGIHGKSVQELLLQASALMSSVFGVTLTLVGEPGK